MELKIATTELSRALGRSQGIVADRPIDETGDITHRDHIEDERPGPEGSYLLMDGVHTTGAP